MIFINFLVQFSDFGINNAVIRKHDLADDDLYTGFTLKIVLGTVAFLFAYLLSPLSKLFFDNAAVTDVIKILSLNFIINSFAFIPNCLLVRDLNYKKLFLPQTGSAIVNYSISIILAINGFRFWSIVIANICSVVVNMILLNAIKPVKIKFAFNSKVAYEFLRFGGNLFLSGTVVFAIFNSDNFIIGSVLGSAFLGYYALSFNWGSLICVIVQDTVHNVLFPAFSKMQHDRDSIKKFYLQVLEFVSFIGVFANVGLLVCSYDFLYYILGHNTDRWLPALTAFRILSVYGIIRSLMEPVANVILTTGKSNLLFKSALIVGITELSLLYPVLKYFNIEGVAVLVTVAYSLQVFFYYPFLKRSFNINFKEIFTSFKPAIFSMIAVVTVILPFEYYVPSSFISFLFKILLVMITYNACYGIMTRWKILKEIKKIIEMRSIDKKNSA